MGLMTDSQWLGERGVGCWIGGKGEGEKEGMGRREEEEGGGMESVHQRKHL